MAKISPGLTAGLLRGTLGNAVLVQRVDGSVIVRQRVIPHDPRTETQEARRLAMAQASMAYRTLTPTELGAWDAYAASLAHEAHVNPTTPAFRTFPVFMRLAMKYLQVHPNGDLPRTPPATPFSGDSISVVATPEPGGIRFTASAPNGADVTTEILLQPLRSITRRPTPTHYRTKACHTFTEAEPSILIEVPAGAWAPAVRFVKTTTGECARLIALPALIVAVA